MNPPSAPRPPRPAEWLLGLLLPRREAEFVMGDLAEQYATDCERGRLFASVNYWTEAAAALWQVPRGPRVGPVHRGDGQMQQVLSNLRAAGKTLRRAPGFTVATALIAAAGLGATTAIFSVVRPILLSPLPYESPSELVMVWERDEHGSESRTGYATFADLARESTTLASSAVRGSWLPTISSGEGAPERLRGQRVTWRFFDLLGVRPALGRTFLASDDVPDRYRVVVLTHGLWQSRFGGDSSIVGRDILVDGRPHEVVGVLPATFDDVFEPSTRIYRVLGYEASQPWACRTCRHLAMVARVRSDVTHDAAAAELNLLSERLVVEYPTSYPAAGVRLEPVREAVTRALRPALFSVLAAAAFLLLIACANVTSLQLARAAKRGEEFAVRTALGAGRLALARQLLAEGVLLAVLGGVAGVAVAWAALRALWPLLPPDLPRLAAVRLDLAALVFAGAVTLGIGVVVGLAPLVTAGGASPFRALRGAGRGGGPGRHRGRASIVVGEVALALMLVVGTGLLARSLRTLLAVHPGFDTDRLLTLEIQATGPAYRGNESVWHYHDEVRQAVEALPGVEAAEISTQLPLGGNFDSFGISATDKPLPNPELAPGAQRYAVSPGYLRAMRIHLLDGREFTAKDNVDSAPRIAIVSASLAADIWGSERAVGKRIQAGNREERTVVGVVADVRHTGLDATALAGFYVPERQWPWAENQVVLVVRTAVDPSSLIPSVVRLVRSIDPSQPITHVRTMPQVIATTTAQRRLALVLFSAFGIAAALLAAAGVYGVLAGVVAERRREIGIRNALGATPGAIVRLVVRRGLALAGGGVVLGLAGAMALTRYLRALLYGVEPTDLATLIGGTALLTAVALAACVVPARRALSVDPIKALRAE